MSKPMRSLVSARVPGQGSIKECISSDYIDQIVNYMNNFAMDVSEIFAETELADTYPDTLPDMISTRDCVQILSNIKRKNHQSPLMIGLIIGVSMRPTGFGQLGYVGMCSSTLDEALIHSGRYLSLVTPLMVFKYSHEGDRMCLELIEVEPLEEPIYVFLIGLLLGSIHAMSLFLLGDTLFKMIDDSKVTLTLGAETYPELKIVQHGPIEWHFSADKNCISFSKEKAFYPLANGNKNSLKLAVVSCDRLLAEQEAKQLQQADRLVHRVEKVLESYDASVPDLDAVAQKLCLSPRTLSRRLNAVDTSFSKVVMDVRMLKSQQLIQEGLLTIKEIAYRLGYTEVSNFSAAFKKYYGKSPGEARRKHLNQQVNLADVSKMWSREKLS